MYNNEEEHQQTLKMLGSLVSLISLHSKRRVEYRCRIVLEMFIRNQHSE